MIKSLLILVLVILTAQIKMVHVHSSVNQVILEKMVNVLSKDEIIDETMMRK